MPTKYHQLSHHQKQTILVAFQGGEECRAIPALLGVSGRSVARVLAEFDINTKRRNRYTLNEGYFDQIDTPIKSYLLGLMAADGCVTDKNYIVRAYPNKGRSGGLVCIVGSKNFTEELATVMEMGSTIAHSHNVVHYWRIFSRTNIQKFYDLMYRYPDLGLARKKEKIEQILGSYHRG